MVSTIRSQVDDVPWYHTIELPGGVVTPGRWDTRGVRAHVPFPASLQGKRCLDVGTWDGFWAFEMERRQASEVVAIDLDDVDRWDWPALPPPEVVARFRAGKDEDRAFSVAHAALGSKVDRRPLSVYDLSPDLSPDPSADGVGTFDFAFVGTILLHLRDPVRALSAIRGVLHGDLLVADQISLSLSLLQPRAASAHVAGVDEPHWWTPNIAGLKRMVHAAGFEVVRSGGPYFLKPGPGAPRRDSAKARLLARVGLPHAWVLARPRPGPEAAARLP
ncbi:MAG: methyltransferase domain-containing protein [Acidimicrobiales bacterium]